MTLKQYILLSQMEYFSTSFFLPLLVSCMPGTIMKSSAWAFPS